MDKQQKYQIFLNWFRENGGLYKKITFPAIIPPLNYTGIVAAQDINRYQVFLAVPKKIIISISKIKVSKLGEIFHLYQVLGNQSSDQTDFNRIVLFLIWHKMMGNQSFYYPYLQCLQKAEPIIKWQNSDIQKLNDPYITVQFVEYLRHDIPLLYEKFNQIAKKHPELFKQEINKEVFLDSYTSVMTRSFGWGLPETMLVPFADFLNHNCCGVQHYVLNSKLEQQKGTYQFQQQYVKKKHQLDASLLNLAKENQIQQRRKWIKSMNRQQEATKQDQLQNNFSIQIYPSSNSEDNDSQQDEIPTQLLQSSKSQLRTITKQVKSELQSKHKEQPNRQIDKQFDDDITFNWWNKMDEKQTYFIVTAQNFIKKGQEIFNSYGRRSNRFLLIWYGFSHLGNKYDSIAFRIWSQEVYKKTGRLLFARYLTQKDWYDKLQLGNQRYHYHNVSDQYRLKNNSINYELMAYLRYKQIRKKQQFRNLLNKKQQIFYHKIISLELQKIVLDQYSSILSKISIVYQLEKQHIPLSSKQKDYFSIIFMQSKKQIFWMHKQGVNILKNVLKKLLDGENLMQIYQSQTRYQNQKDKGLKYKRFLNHYFKMLQQFFNKKKKQKQST